MRVSRDDCSWVQSQLPDIYRLPLDHPDVQRYNEHITECQACQTFADEILDAEECILVRTRIQLPPEVTRCRIERGMAQARLIESRRNKARTTIALTQQSPTHWQLTESLPESALQDTEILIVLQWGDGSQHYGLMDFRGQREPGRPILPPEDDVSAEVVFEDGTATPVTFKRATDGTCRVVCQSLPEDVHPAAVLLISRGARRAHQGNPGIIRRPSRRLATIGVIGVPLAAAAAVLFIAFLRGNSPPAQTPPEADGISMTVQALNTLSGEPPAAGPREYHVRVALAEPAALHVLALETSGDFAILPVDGNRYVTDVEGEWDGTIEDTDGTFEAFMAVTASRSIQRELESITLPPARTPELRWARFLDLAQTLQSTYGCKTTTESLFDFDEALSGDHP